MICTDCTSPAALQGQGCLRASQPCSSIPASQQRAEDYSHHRSPRDGRIALAAEQPSGESLPGQLGVLEPVVLALPCCDRELQQPRGAWPGPKPPPHTLFPCLFPTLSGAAPCQRGACLCSRGRAKDTPDPCLLSQLRPGKAPQGLRPPCCRRNSSSHQFDHQ